MKQANDLFSQIVTVLLGGGGLSGTRAMVDKRQARQFRGTESQNTCKNCKQDVCSVQMS